MNLDQPAPTPNDLPAVWSLVMADMNARDQIGRERYGVPLQPHNGRDALKDAYAEALDLCAYLRQAIYERDGVGGDRIADEPNLYIGQDKPASRGRGHSWPPTDLDTPFAYSFSVWPEEQHPRWTRPVFDLFRMMYTRTVEIFTEREFNDFREELAKCGLTLREVERSPYFAPKMVA